MQDVIVWEGFAQDPGVNIFASHDIPNKRQLTMFVFFSHLEKKTSPAAENVLVGCRICAKGLKDALGFVQHSRTATSACLGKGQ